MNLMDIRQKSNLDQMREIWATILDQDPGDIIDEDAFFEIGGDSITAQELVRLASQHGMLLSLQQIFNYPSLREMTEKLEYVELSEDSKSDATDFQSTIITPFELLSSNAMPQQLQIETLALACGVNLGDVEDAFPCTPMQESIMIASADNENLYLRQLVYKLEDDVELERLKGAWDAIIQANSVLRTRIVHLEGIGFLQAILKSKDPIWGRFDNLDQFLSKDRLDPMLPGLPLFRYTIIVEGHSRYFVWSVHHALCDGTSILEIQGELHLRLSHSVTLERQPFVNFVQSLRERRPEAPQFWTQYLSNMHPIPYPRLPIGAPGSLSSSSSLESVVDMDGSQITRVPKALLLRAAWAVLLFHHTGGEDVVFGTILSGRSNMSQVPGISRMTGPTINLLPVGVRVNPEESVHSFLDRILGQAGDLADFEQTSTSTIRQYLAADGALGSTNVLDFNTLFVVQPQEFTQATASQLEGTGLRYINKYGKIEQHSYPLVFSASLPVAASDAVHILVQYDERVLPTQQAHNLVNQFQSILAQLGNATTQTLLGSITPFNNQDLLQICRWNRNPPATCEKCVHWLFQAKAYEQPNAEAVCSEEMSLSYAELENASSHLALQLIASGVGPKTFVAVVFEKSICTVVAMLAVLKAGGAFVPIDPEHPSARIIEVLDIAQIGLVLASPKAAERVRGLCEHVIVVENPSLGYVSHACFEMARPNSVAYVLFTSGSTGKPKGVMMTHSALCTSILSHGAVLGDSPACRRLQFSSHTFDASITEFFTTLVHGGCVCIPSDQNRLDNLAGAITSLRVNTALLTPTVASLLNPEDVPTLTSLALGGEAVTKDVLLKWGGRVRLINAYGPTEACVICSMNPDLTVDSNPSHIGRSVGATMWIVDPGNHHQLSAIGCIGEIVLSGPTLAQGYLGDKTATDVSFVTPPKWLTGVSKAAGMGGRLYKTGDLGRYTSDGVVEILGRKDTQVKLHGLRIELDEIETRIMESGSAKAVVSFLPSAGLCADRIVSIVNFNHARESSKSRNHYPISEWISRGKEDEDNLERVKTYIGLKLPEYMLPSVWIVLAKMPILVSGKIDRKAIQVWVREIDANTLQQLTGVTEIEEPEVTAGIQGAILEKLRAIWSDVLNVPREKISMNTSFFALGGDSISAIRIVSKLKQEQFSLQSRDILTCKTLKGLAHRLAEIQNGDINSSSLRPSLSPEGDSDNFMLSPIQHLFLASNADVADTARFNQAMILKLRWSVEQEKIHDAFSAVVKRHPMLRTAFSHRDNKTQQMIAHGPQWYRFQAHGGRLREDDIHNLIAISQKSISIRSGPVFSVDLFTDFSGTTCIFVTAHHLVVDLVSWRILLQDVDDYVTTGSFKEPLTASFQQWTRAIDAVAAGSDHSVSKELDSSIDEDMVKLLGLEPTRNTYGDAETVSWSLDQKATEELFAIAGDVMVVEPVEIMIAAIASSFSQAFQHSCPTLFVEGHGREPLDSGIDLSSTIGWFTIFYPIANFPDFLSARFRGYVRHVQAERKRFPDNGLKFFSTAMSDEQHMRKFMSKPIQFNYHGKYQQFENDKSLFTLSDFQGLEETLIDHRVKRMSIFEIEAAVRDDRLQFALSFPSHLTCKTTVLRWFDHIRLAITDMGSLTRSEGAVLIPALSTSIGILGLIKGDNRWADYKDVLEARLEVNKTVRIEDVYICSPMQTAILGQQAHDPSAFLVSWDVEICSSKSLPVELDRVAEAWRAVVRKHAILRTSFLQDTSGNLPPLQVVLANIEADITMAARPSPAELPEPFGYDSLLNHRAWFYKDADTVIAHIEINHALIDGWSLNLIKADLAAMYAAGAYQIPSPPGALYKNFIKAHTPQAIEADNQYWDSVVRHIRSTLACAHPIAERHGGVGGDICRKGHRNITTFPPLHTSLLSSFGSRYGLTNASIIDALWAQALSIHTGSPEVCFAYVVSGRQLADLPEVFEIVGPMINVLLYHLRGISVLDNTNPPDWTQELAQLASQVQQQRMADEGHVFTTIPGSDSQVGNKEMRQLTNTAVNYQRRSKALETDDLVIRDLESSGDPWPYDILLRVMVDEELTILQIESNPNAVDTHHVEKLIEVFRNRLDLVRSYTI